MAKKKNEESSLAVQEVGEVKDPIAEETVEGQSYESVNMANPQETLKEKILKQKAYDCKMVTGKFLNQRAPGKPVRLTYHKYATDPVKWYDFEHGKTYTIPRGFADQINDHYAKITYAKKEGENAVISDPSNPGTGLLHMPIRQQMYAFVPVSF